MSSELARTHLRQARGMLRTGQSERAVELLEKAKVLARDDAEMLRLVLEELAEIYEQLGRTEQAARAREKLARIPVPQVTEAEAPMAPMITAGPAPRRSRWPSGLTWALAGTAAAILILCLIGGGVWMMSNRSDATADQSKAVVVPTTLAAVINPASTSPATGPATTAPAVVAATTEPGLPAGWDRQRLLKDTVGIVFVVAHYEGVAGGRTSRVDLPISSGTSFAVTSSGIMLTNKHVVEPPPEDPIPTSLSIINMPSLTLRSTSHVVCFGTTPQEQFPARVLYKSTQFDVSVLQIQRHFACPLALSKKAIRQSDDIVVCGYPGIVTEALSEANNTQTRIRDISRKWKSSNHIDAMDAFPPDVFNSTLTRGIVSAAERHVRGVEYIQIDAAISPGNSGGPVLTNDNCVIGIATWGIRAEAAMSNSYNFALAVEQLETELEPYLKK